jgi:hypothetical protein
MGLTVAFWGGSSPPIPPILGIEPGGVLALMGRSTRSANQGRSTVVSAIDSGRQMQKNVIYRYGGSHNAT